MMAYEAEGIVLDDALDSHETSLRSQSITYH